MCRHEPLCPSATSADHTAAHTVAAHPDQGWSLLCNGVIVFDDFGELLPDGRGGRPALGREPIFAINAFVLGAWATGMIVSQSLGELCIMKSTGSDATKVFSTMKALN